MEPGGESAHGPGAHQEFPLVKKPWPSSFAALSSGGPSSDGLTIDPSDSHERFRPRGTESAHRSPSGLRSYPLGGTEHCQTRS